MRQVAGMKRVDQRNMGDLREEPCLEKCLMGRLVEAHEVGVKSGRNVKTECEKYEKNHRFMRMRTRT